MKAKHEFRGGKSLKVGDRAAGYWPQNIDSTKGGFKEIYELIDQDWVSSAPSILRDLSQKVAGIRKDAKLSELGKREAIQQAGLSALNRLKNKTAKVDRLQEELLSGLEDAIKTPTPSLNDTMIDLAMAAHLREQVKEWQNGDFAGPSSITSRLQDLSERARLAVIRVPAELSGIDTQIQTAVRTTFVDPATAKHLEDTSYAINVARDVVQASIEEMVSLAQLPKADVQDAIGPGWDASGVRPGRKPADFDMTPTRKGDSALMASQRAEEDSASWAAQESAAGRTVTEEQRIARREELTQQYISEAPQVRTFTGRESLHEATNKQERLAIIEAGLKAVA